LCRPSYPSTGTHCNPSPSELPSCPLFPRVSLPEVIPEVLEVFPMDWAAAHLTSHGVGSVFQEGVGFGLGPEKGGEGEEGGGGGGGGRKGGKEEEGKEEEEEEEVFWR